MIKILVTGGSGFLGKAIIDELIDPSSPVAVSHIRILDQVDYIGKYDTRIEFRKGDVRDYEFLLDAVNGMDIIIHSAAIVDWGTKSDEEIYSVNVEGTRNVIEACREAGIRYLVYTSSLDAIFGGKPLVNIDESIPYPEEHPTSYCSSKFLAEKLVRESNDAIFKTCSLRPSDIYGENDPYHIGSLLKMAKGGFYVRLGDGKAQSQHTYVRNIAYAHLLAAKALMDGNEAICGNAYLITDGPGSNFFHFFDRIVEGAGYKIWPKDLWIPRPVAMFIGDVSEGIAVLARPFKKYTPKMSRFAVTYTCTDFTFSSEKAKKDFRFVPKYSEEEAFERTVNFYRKAKNQNADDTDHHCDI
jgi:nucleoside-diphosphate-sugar epimerase